MTTGIPGSKRKITADIVEVWESAPMREAFQPMHDRELSMH